MTQAWIDDVEAYCGIAAVDVYLGATQLRRNDPANLYYPGEFRYGGGHVIEKLVTGERLELHAQSYGTDEYPLRELRTWFTIERPEPGHHGEPAQLLPELQRGGELLRPAAAHLPRAC